MCKVLINGKVSMPYGIFPITKVNLRPLRKSRKELAYFICLAAAAPLS